MDKSLPVLSSLKNPLGSVGTRPSPTRAKLGELTARLNDLDLDLTQQHNTRQAAKQKVEFMERNLEQYNQSSKKMTIALAEAEDRIQRLENAVHAERSGHELFTVEMHRLVEERVTHLVSLLESERIQRTAELDALRTKAKALEDRNRQLEVQVAEYSKQIHDLSNGTISKVQESITSLLRASDFERRSGPSVSNTEAMRKFMVMLTTLQNELHGERVARERDVESQRKALQSEFAALRHLVDAERSEREQTNERVIGPVWKELRRLQEELENEGAERERSVANQQQQVFDRLAVVKISLERATSSIDEQQNRRLKEIEDRLWKLDAMLESEVSTRKMEYQALAQAIGSEKREREENEQELLTVLDQISVKLRDSLERH
eukprot:TRINITY_DN17112_c0_g1_i1.p1 TRINITY_DN17112_c0_g1~~TRINITY_DN17112_c0_g1_i1.p1  ORF type:complete len:379 (-),score=79.24 TRINITY_DN17112_c0_g1_i1:2-1138(-)